MVSEEMIFEYFFRKFSLLVAMATPIKFSSLDKIHMVGRGLLKGHFCKVFCQNVCSEIEIKAYYLFFPL